ncbi:MAG: RNA polymerase sigma factor SigM [Mycobacteriaceae bacterium]
MGAYPDDHRTDADLLAAHADGDRSAFGELFRRHRTRLLRTARRRGASAEDADDTLQDAMISAYRAAGSFRHESAVSSWLHRITVNACTDVQRRKGPHTVPLSADHPPPVADRSGHIETAVVVRQAMMRLPAEQRAAVLAVDMHGYSVSDAAALLNVAEGTVKSRCSRGRARLAVLLRHLAPAAPG